MAYPIIFELERIYYPVLAAIGITVNLVAIVILSRGKCGLSKCITRYLVAMAAADLTVVIIEVILKRINNIYLPINFLFITPICALKLVTKIAALDCSVWFTVAFTFDRFVAICCQNLKPRYCTQRTASIVVATVCVLACLRSIPFYFLYEPKLIINNIPYFCIENTAYYTSPLWAAYGWFDSILTPLVPIFLILLFNAFTVRHIIMSNIVRRALLSNVDNQDDPESENRKKSMILLFTLSGNFILLWLTYVVHSLSWQVVNYNYTDKYYSNPIYINQQTGFMLQLLSSCTNTCIYGLTQRKFREELKNGAKYLFTLNGILFNLVAIMILPRGKCGLSKCITRYLVGMAVANLLVIIFNVILFRIKSLYFPLSLPDITPTCCSTNVLRFTAITVSVWLTVAFTFDRLVAICCVKLKTQYCTRKTAAVVLGAVSVLGCLESVPVYFEYGSQKVINDILWLCVPKASFYTSVEWTAFEVFHRSLTPCLPFLLVLQLNTLTTRRVLATSRVHRRLCGDTSPKDPELENRQISVDLLFTISGSFMVLWVTQIMFYLHQRIAANYYRAGHPAHVAESTGTMLQLSTPAETRGSTW